MTPDLEFHPAAEAELLAAEEWYTERSIVAARAFVFEVGLALERIRAAPERWPLHRHGARRLVLHRFPYSIVYRTTRGRVEVVAVAHQSRKPGYWAGR